MIERFEPKSKSNIQLVLGSPIEEQLGIGEIHTYVVEARRGQYFRVVVMQKGIDVVVTVKAPDGKLITEVDSPNRRYGPEPISVIADLSGLYQMEIRPFDLKGLPGRYEITFHELREPTELDKKRVVAERLLAEAQQLHSLQNKQSLNQAMSNCRQALPLLRAIGDQWKEAETLQIMGRAHFLLGEMRAALTVMNKGLDLVRVVGDRHGEATGLNNIGNCYYRLGEHGKAIEFHHKALILSQLVNDASEVGYVLRNIGNVYASTNFRESTNYLNQALLLARQVQDQFLEANVLSCLGGLYSKYAEPHKALRFYSDAMLLYRSLGDKWEEARTLGSVGNVYLILGESQKALESFIDSLALLPATGNRLAEANTLVSIGSTYALLGELEEALTYFEKAMTTAETLENPPAQACARRAAALAYRDLGKFQTALDYLNRAQALFHTTGDQFGEAQTLAEIGSILATLAEHDKAASHLTQALRLQRKVNDRLGQAFSLSEMGTVYASLGKISEAVDSLKSALKLQQNTGDKKGEALTLYRLAKVERERAQLEAARTYAEAAIAIIDGIRIKLYHQHLRTSFSASLRSYYELYIDVLMEMHRISPTAGYDAIALQINEQARARSFLESLSESRADIRQGVDPALIERELSTRQQLNAKAERLMRLLREKHSLQEEDEARNKLAELVTDYRNIEAQIRAQSPSYAALTQPQALNLQQIQQRVLDEDTILIEYALGEEHSYAFVVSKHALTSYQLPNRAVIESVARNVYQLLINKSDRLYPDALTQLSQMVLKPMAAQMVGKRLLIVSDGALQYVPFAALPTPIHRTQRPKSEMGEPLILGHEILTLPSASVLDTLRQQVPLRNIAKKKMVVLADPVFDSDDRRVRHGPGSSAQVIRSPERDNRGRSLVVERAANDVGIESFERLPMSRREAEFITESLPEGQFFMALDFAANSRLARGSEISQYQIVHFATHSLLNNQHPELTGIVLSLVDEHGQPEDGFFRLHEIYNLKLNADLVVLSACQTALGKEVKGEGLIGLTRGFMYAGAARVVASLWKVSDHATAELMKRFYRNLLTGRLSPSAALRAAQISLLDEKQWKAPYYWAAFTIQGEWN